jgi:hypothetical protein
VYNPFPATGAILFPMTKLQMAYRLSRPLAAEDLEKISRMHSVYGVFAVKLSKSLDELHVEYDASRLTEADLRATLEHHGLPLAA